jgi:AGCS family alanine or glycine:cation symporter
MKNLSKIIFLVTTIFITSSNAFGSEKDSMNATSIFFDNIATFLENIIFYNIPFVQFPFLVLWLAIAGLFFSFKLRFVNIRLIKHALKTVFGKYDEENSKGSITPRQALFTTISATVGLGNIAGVAVAVVIGGPGAVIWMMLVAFFGMATIFSEVLMSQKYRAETKDKNGKSHYSGGPFLYLKDGLKDIGMARLGKFLSIFFTILCLFGTIGVSLFQSNQMIASITVNFSFLSNYKPFLALLLSFLTGIVLIGGITRISHIAEKIVPAMAILYVAGCLVVLAVHYSEVPEAILLMFQHAFNFNDASAVTGGLLGALVAGVKRAVFSNEAGIGTSPIANAAAKSLHPTRQASVASLTPIIDTIIICFMTGIVITVTKTYQIQNIEGVELTAIAFRSVANWFSYILAVAVPLFAYSTIITYGYYGRSAWNHLFGAKNTNIFYFIYCSGLFVAGIISFGIVVRLADIFVLSMAIPNLIGLYLLSGVIKKEAFNYFKKFKNGEFCNSKLSSKI